MSWPYPACVAHRGAGRLAPENTLIALDTGWEHGYRAAEVDAALTEDGVAVLLHDATLERTTNGRGSVANIRAAALAKLDAGSWLDPRFAHARVPTLIEALQRCHELGIWLNIEIKPVPGHDEHTGAVVARTVAAFWAQAPRPSLGAPNPPPLPVLSSFSPVALAAARQAAPSLRLGLLLARVPPDWQEHLRALGAFSLHCDHRHLDVKTIAAVRRAGYGLLAYTVNDPARAQLLRSWGVDAICTDRIELLDPADGTAAAA